MNRIYLVAAFLLLGAVSGFARKKHDTPGTGNPVIPGYFADPTIKKFGDTYYMYATTDGSGAGFGPWCSLYTAWLLIRSTWATRPPLRLRCLSSPLLYQYSPLNI